MKPSLSKPLVKKVFLIDDDPIFVFLARKMIEVIDASVDLQVFSDGELAMTELDRSKGDTHRLPDLILLDLNMPIMDGWQFLDYFASVEQTIGKQISLHILSSTISPDDIQRSAGYPFISGFLIKPVELEKLAVLFSAPKP